MFYCLKRIIRKYIHVHNDPLKKLTRAEIAKRKQNILIVLYNFQQYRFTKTKIVNIFNELQSSLFGFNLHKNI